MTGIFDFGSGDKPPPLSGAALRALCEELEHYETPWWAIRAILRQERLEGLVLDPCCGTGILSIAAEEAGYSIVASDIHDWGYAGLESLIDFMDYEALP